MRAFRRSALSWLSIRQMSGPTRSSRLRRTPTFSGVDVEHLDWAPPEWVRNGFPLPAPEEEVVTMEFVVTTLDALADAATEADMTPLGAVLHVAHLLKTMQGADGRWPDKFNAR